MAVPAAIYGVADGASAGVPSFIDMRTLQRMLKKSFAGHGPAPQKSQK
jgi:hypothetical protein